MSDAKSRVVTVKQRYICIWFDNQPHINLHKRLYKPCVCSIMACMTTDNEGDGGAERGKCEHGERHHGKDNT